MALSSDNVCGIHMLADKYDVPLLKEEAVNAMEDILSGARGSALSSSLAWLRYIEQLIPDLQPACYDAIRTNFDGFYRNDEYINTLESRDLLAILSSNDIVVVDEMSIFHRVRGWAASKFKNLSSAEASRELKPILKLVRFHNMDTNNLQTVENSLLCKAFGKSFICDYLFPAYKIHSQMQRIASDRSEMSQGNDQIECPYNCNDDCSHLLNPRLYTTKPYGALYSMPYPRSGHAFRHQSVSVKPVDLTDVKKYANLQLRPDHSRNTCNESWQFKCEANYESTQENDIFTLTPSSSHVGRQYTVAITAMTVSETRHVRDSKTVKFRYTIKCTGVVDGRVREVKHFVPNTQPPITIHSQKRPEGSWNTEISTNDDEEKLVTVVRVSIYLMSN